MQCAYSGSRICVLSEVVGKQYALSSFDVVRGKQGELARIDSDGWLDWDLSPDSSKISIVENPGDSVRVFEFKSGRSRVIHPIPPQKGLQEAAWSEDGNRLFVTVFPTSSRGRLLEMDPDGHTHLLLENSGWVGSILPSPDGKHIAFTTAVDESNVALLEHF
jgi:WD40 repeat protein